MEERLKKEKWKLKVLISLVSILFFFCNKEFLTYSFKTSLLIQNRIGMDKEGVVSLIGLASMSD